MSGGAVEAPAAIGAACSICGDTGGVLLPEGWIACPMCCSAPLMWRPRLVVIPCERCGEGIERCGCEVADD